MMDWTDRHCRAFHRLLTRRARLYTEMVTTGALLHGDVPRHLDFGAIEHPVALQLGGSEPADLAACVELACAWGYDEVNLNCGCPSERVQRGAFGACLMAEPRLVAECVRAMIEAAAGRLPVTVKHRIGIDHGERYAFVRDFVGALADAGCEVFIVHARNAWLQGLSPKENREVPPLRYAFVHDLKRDFPAATIVLNGGICTDAAIAEQLREVDGVMLGRHAYHEPWAMAGWDATFFGVPGPAASRAQVEAAWVEYLGRIHEAGTPWPHAMRHALGLWNGTPGARRWRQVWSDHRLKLEAPRVVADLATEARLAGARLAA
jgi:tRNA-dihydrouridine synthase A